MLALHRLSCSFSFAVLIMASQVLVFSSTNSELEFFSLIQNSDSHSPISNCHVHLWRVWLSYPKVSLPRCPFFLRSNLLRHWIDMSAPMKGHTLDSSCRDTSTCKFLLRLLSSPVIIRTPASLSHCALHAPQIRTQWSYQNPVLLV